MAVQKCVVKLAGLCARSKYRSGLLSKQQLPQLKLHGTRALSEEGLRGSRSSKPSSESGSSQEHPLSLMETEYEKLRVEMKKMHSELLRHISESVKPNTSQQQFSTVNPFLGPKKNHYFVYSIYLEASFFKDGI
ncbi:hypothetical protein ABKV19_000191 [Rosa sericea]